jgi:hypothetical protein
VKRKNKNIKEDYACLVKGLAEATKQTLGEKPDRQSAAKSTERHNAAAFASTGKDAVTIDGKPEPMTVIAVAADHSHARTETRLTVRIGSGDNETVATLNEKNGTFLAQVEGSPRFEVEAEKRLETLNTSVKAARKSCGMPVKS